MTQQLNSHIDTDRFDEFADTLAMRFSVLPNFKEEFASKIFACLQQHNVAITEDIEDAPQTSKLDELYVKAKLITPTLTREDFERLIDPTLTMLDQKEEKEYVPLIPRIKKRFSTKKEVAPLPVTLEQVANTIEEKFSLVSLEIDSLLLQPSLQLKESIKQVVKATVTEGKTTNISAADYDYLQTLYNKQMILAGKEREFALLAGDIYAADNLHHTPPLKQAMIWPFEAEITAWKKKWLPSQRKIGFDGQPLTEEMKKKNLDYYTSWKEICGDAPWLDVAVWETTTEEQWIINKLIFSLDQQKLKIVFSTLLQQIPPTKANILLLLQATALSLPAEWTERALICATPKQKQAMQQLVLDDKGYDLGWVAKVFDWDPIDKKLIINFWNGNYFKFHHTSDKALRRHDWFTWMPWGEHAPNIALHTILTELQLENSTCIKKHNRLALIQHIWIGARLTSTNILIEFFGAKHVWTMSTKYDIDRKRPIMVSLKSLQEKEDYECTEKAHVCIFTTHEKKK